MFAGPALVGADNTPAPAAVAKVSGSQVFEKAGCGGCHTFKAAGATGAVGPNLDTAGVSEDAVAAVVTGGRGGMPAFGTRLTPAEIRAVARYVASGGKEQAAAEATPAAADGQRAPRVVATIPADDGPDGIVVTRNGAVWVANASAGTLALIPAGEDAFEPDSTPAGRQPDSPVEADGNVWVVASADDAVLRLKEGEATKVPVGREPSGLAIDARTVWVANGGDGTLTRIDRASGEVREAPIEVGGRPTDVAVADGVVWVTDFEGGRVVRVAAASGEVAGDPIPVGRNPRGIAIGEGSAWVANAGDDTVTRIDAASGEVAGDPIEVGDNPRELAVGEGAVWVANAGDDTVSRIDPKSAEVVGDPIEVGDDPIGIAVGGGAVWTANFRADTVTKIEP